MSTVFLTEEEKSSSLNKVYRFQGFNGLGFNFMGETPVYLMAIQFGATNIELGYISSGIYIAGFMLIFLPRLLAGKNLIQVQSTAWFIRGLLVLLYLLLFFIQGRAAVTLILIVYTLFCLVRMIGAVIWQPLVKMVTNSQNRGEVFAQGNIANQGASIISKLVSFILTSFNTFSGILGILLLQVLGVIFNTFAAFELTKIPCRESVEYQKSRSLFVILKEAIVNRHRKYPLLIRWFSISALVLNGLTIVFVRKEAGFDPNIVFLYTMMIAAANVLASLFSKKFSDRVGSRPLLIGVNIFYSLFMILWILVPINTRELPVGPFFILGFITNFFLLANNLLTDRIIVNTMPDSDSFGYNSMIKFVTAFFSFGSGILGGLLIDAGQSLHSLLPNNYTILFIFLFILGIVMVFISIRIIDKGSLSPKETAAILFSIDGLRVYNAIDRLKSESDPVRKKTVILSITQSDTDIALKEMISILNSPLSPGKGDVIKSLFSHPREELLDLLIKEASDYGSYHQMKAIFALGAYPDKRVEDLLVSFLNHPNPGIRSNAAKSLGRIGHTESLERVRILATEATETWDCLNYLIALKNMDESGDIFSHIYRTPENLKPGIFRQTYYSLVSELLDFRPSLSKIYSLKNNRVGDGVKDFLELTRDSEDFNNSHKKLIRWFKDEEWTTIADFCFKILNGCNFPENAPRGNLKKALTESMVYDYDDALSFIYFTYNLLRSL